MNSYQVRFTSRASMSKFMNKTWVGLLIAVLGSTLFSAKAIIVKLAYQDAVDPVTFLALRMVFAMPIFWAVHFWFKRGQIERSLTLSEILQLLLLGFVGYYFSSLMDFIGLQYLTAGVERIILYLTPTLVVLISFFVLKKEISAYQWVALAVAYFGVVTVFMDDLAWTEQIVFGSLCVFISALTYAAYLIFSGELVARVGSIRLVCFASTGSMIFGLIHACSTNPHALVSQTPRVYLLSLFNSVFCTVIPMILIMTAVRRIGSSLTAQAGMVGPVATIFLGWAFLAELPRFTQILGTIIILIGVSFLLKVNSPEKPSNPKVVD